MPPTPLHSDDLIAALHSGRVQVLEDLYASYRAHFFRWAGRRIDANRQDLEDAWQEAVTAFYTQIMAGKLNTLRYEPRVWLFAVGYRILLKNNRKLNRIYWKDNIDKVLREDASWLDYQENISRKEKKEFLRVAMKTMSNQCREMLVQRYFMEKSVEEIQEEWNHNSTNTTSATLSRCLKRLKDLLKSARAATV